MQAAIACDFALQGRCSFGRLSRFSAVRLDVTFIPATGVQDVMAAAVQDVIPQPQAAANGDHIY